MTHTKSFLVGSLFLLVAQTAPAQPPAPAPPGTVLPAAGAPVEFIAQAKLLFRIAACGDGSPLPARLDAKAVGEHCAKLKLAEDGFQKSWIALAKPFIAARRPADIPKAVVYPFGGGDLLMALVTFPDAPEITTLSLEPAGDARPIDSLAPDAVLASIEVSRDKLVHLFHFAHSLTSDLSTVSRRNRLPGELIDALVGLSMNGYEPVSLRYFQLAPDGTPRFVTASDLAASDALPEAQERAKLFANMEIGFRAIGNPSAPVRYHRHIGANLDDKHLSVDPRILRYLEAKGRISAMTKAASYLLWWKNFTMFRDYLLHNMEWMISDSTGIPPHYAHPAGFEQDTYGRFDGPLLGNDKFGSDDFKAVWNKNPQRPLAFMYGYPDSNHHAHMVITYRKKATP